jgi:predicted dehydrogenase
MALKVCVIGCGFMGKQHARAWNEREDCEVVAVADPYEEWRLELAGEMSAMPYENWREAVQHEGVDVVSVCTPTCLHKDMACFAASHGRHVLCEKPLAKSLDEADAMLEAAEKNSVLLSTSLQYRDFTHNRRLKEVMDDGSFGGPIFLRYIDIREVRPKLAMHRKSMNNGPVLDMLPHYFDIMRHFTGSEPEAVFATGHVFGEGKKRLAEIDDLAIDAADVQVRYANGHVLSVHVNWGMPEDCENVSHELMVSPDSLARREGDTLHLMIKGNEETLEVKWAGPEHRIANMAEAVQGKHPLEVTGENGRIALRVSLAAFESIETGRSVEIA